MPEKNIDISGVSVGVGVVVAVISSYIVFVIKTIFNKIATSNAEVKKDLEHQRESILSLYTASNQSIAEIARIEERIEAIKSTCEKNHRG